jgi:hypothetical protein
MTQRHFTRLDIEAEFWKRFGAYENPIWTIQEVKLLPELTPPTWFVGYKCTYQPGTEYTSTHYDHMLFLEKSDFGELYLNSPTELIDLPAGCTTVQEEDAEIDRRAEAWREAREAKAVQPRSAAHSRCAKGRLEKF